MDVAAYLAELRSSPRLRDRVVHLRQEPPRRARHADPALPLPATLRAFLRARNIERLWLHQARSLDLVRKGRDVLVTTGPASGKTLCYLLPLLEILEAEPESTALCLFPAKALSRDQLRVLLDALRDAGLPGIEAGVCDGDTPGPERRRLRDRASVILTNPDMLHAAILPEHARWSRLFARLRLLVIDELHVYSGIFGTNMAHLMGRLHRVCRHHGSEPRIVSCSATIGNPEELASEVTGRDLARVGEDGSPRGRRTWLFWNPPRVRDTRRRSRRSANVEAKDVYADLVARGVPTIVFSKARVTAELIHRFATEALRRRAPGLARRIAAYRGGYVPEERREIEGRLFRGELLGVSATRALELGIDVGGLDAAVVVGYPGSLAAFFQQAGRAGRRDRDSLVVLVGLDTAINQYVLRHPEYVFGRPVENAVIDRENPYVLTGHLRCAARELPVEESETAGFGGAARTILEVLEENRKVRRIAKRWYHAASETPQHEISLRDATDRNVVVQDRETGRLLGEVSKFDAPTVVHPGAVYLHHGETWLVETLDTERSVATVRREDLDHYTQSLGSEDVHHIDRMLREKPFGAAQACFGEVTAHFAIHAYERIRFYTLDAVSRHPLDLPTYPIETMAFWVVPPEPLMRKLRREGLDPVSGLHGIGFALRMHLPLFVTCDTLDLSHCIGSVNSPWNAVFVWEHYPRGLGFTEKGYDLLHRLVPDARDTILRCGCEDGCPLCVGKPLHPYTVLNPERGEGSVPSRAAALSILDGILGDGRGLAQPDRETLSDSPDAERLRLARTVRRRLERMGEPDVLRPPPPGQPPGWPDPERASELEKPDAARRGERRREFHRRLTTRLSAQERRDDGPS